MKEIIERYSPDGTLISTEEIEVPDVPLDPDWIGLYDSITVSPLLEYTRETCGTLPQYTEFISVIQRGMMGGNTDFLLQLFQRSLNNLMLVADYKDEYVLELKKLLEMNNLDSIKLYY